MKRAYYKYGSIALISSVLVLSYMLVKPFIFSIITSAIIAYVFYPIYAFLVRKIKRPGIASLLMCILVFLLVILPFFFLLNSVIREIPGTYIWLTENVQKSNFFQNPIFERLQQDLGLTFNLNSFLGSLSSSLIRYAQNILTSIPNMMLNASIAAFLLYFFFKDGPTILNKIFYYLPFKKKDSFLIQSELKKTADAVLYGQIITALVQSIIALISYFILGVKGAIFWGFLTFIFSLIPMIGPSFVYIPISLGMLIQGILNTESGLIIRGIIMAVIGFGIISSVDNIIKPLVISDKVRMHPALVLIGVIGGLAAFGVIGILLGPLVLVLLVTLLSIYENKDII